MYKCNECEEEKSTDWCDKHQKLLKCDCSEITSSRVKDIYYDCDEGERTLTIYINHCETCGEVTDIDYN